MSSDREGNIDLSQKHASAGIDFEALPSKFRQAVGRLNDTEIASFFGLGNKGRQSFDSPGFIATESEDVMVNGNASIVLGLDRPSNRLSGYGGMGHSHCAAIDIVAGRLGAYAVSKTTEGDDVLVNPNFKLDAARVYLSQKADVDGYFGLADKIDGSTSPEDPRSAIALKADTVRLIARENIRLVTRTDKRNSQGGETNNSFMGQYGISLIAMNDDSDMHPLVKGNNLVDCLNAILESVANLRTLLENHLEYTRNLANTLMTHTHTSPFFGIDNAPDYKGLIPEGVDFILNQCLNVEIPCILQHMQETNSIVSDYLEDGGGMQSEKFILSKFNSTN